MILRMKGVMMDSTNWYLIVVSKTPDREKWTLSIILISYRLRPGFLRRLVLFIHWLGKGGLERVSGKINLRQTCAPATPSQSTAVLEELRCFDWGPCSAVVFDWVILLCRCCSILWHVAFHALFPSIELSLFHSRNDSPLSSISPAPIPLHSRHIFHKN